MRLTAGALLSLGIPLLLATQEAVAPESETITPSARRSFRAPLYLIGVLALIQLLQAAGESTARTFFNVYLDHGLHVPTHVIGILAATGQLAAVPAALVTPLLIARWRNGPTIIRAALGVACSLLPMALIQRLGAVSFGYTGVLVMATIWRTPVTVYRMEIVSPRWRALMSGASNMSLGVSYAAMGLGGAHIAQNAGYGSVFLVSAILTVLGTLLFWAFDRVPRGEFARPVVPHALQ